MSEALATRWLLTLEVEVGAPLEFGDVGSGARRCIPLLGGKFYGDIEGEVVPGGADWQSVRSSGALEIDAHYALRTSLGETLEVVSTGVRHAPAEVLARLARAEPVASHEYYFRTQLRFRSAAPRLARFNTLLAVSVGERLPKLVRLRVFEVL
jgi:hypothetical protein